MTRPEPTADQADAFNLMSKRLEMLKESVKNTSNRKRTWIIKAEIEVIEANMGVMRRLYRFD